MIRLEAGADRLEWPRLEILGPLRYRLLERYAITWQSPGAPLQRLIMKAGFECNGASVPAAAEWIVPREKLLKGAVPHDLLYEYQGVLPVGLHGYRDDAGVWRPVTRYTWSRRDSDRFFARCLTFADHLEDWQRSAAYLAVRVGGCRAWSRGVPATERDL